MAISGIVPLTVDFTNTSTGENLVYLWDFGDGQTSMEANPSHIYQVVGDYTVTLTTTNNYGTDTKLDYISVSLGVSVPPEGPGGPPPGGKGKGKGVTGPPAGIYQYGAAGGPPGGNGKGTVAPPGGNEQQQTGPPPGIYQYGAAGGPPGVGQDEK
jgi:PKD repeat protein